MRKIKISLAIVGVLLIIHVGFYYHATTSPQWKYAKKALACKDPNYDLRYCIDLPLNSRKNFTHDKNYKPLPCINTATSFYDEIHRAANCNKFMSNPGKWGFNEVNANAALPGDLILFLRKSGNAYHAGVFTMNSLLGPLCANTTDHSTDPREKGKFLHYMPIIPYKLFRIGGCSEVKYYRCFK